MHRMTYSSVHLCNPPEAISDDFESHAQYTSICSPPQEARIISSDFIFHLITGHTQNIFDLLKWHFRMGDSSSWKLCVEILFQAEDPTRSGD